MSNFVLVSSVGADPASRAFYLRVKGEVEAALRKLQVPPARHPAPGPAARAARGRPAARRAPGDPVRARCRTCSSTATGGASASIDARHRGARRAAGGATRRRAAAFVHENDAIAAARAAAGRVGRQERPPDCSGGRHAAVRRADLVDRVGTGVGGRFDVLARAATVLQAVAVSTMALAVRAMMVLRSIVWSFLSSVKTSG